MFWGSWTVVVERQICITVIRMLSEGEGYLQAGVSLKDAFTLGPDLCLARSCQTVACMLCQGLA